jgi:hypothetical protein
MFKRYLKSKRQIVLVVFLLVLTAAAALYSAVVRPWHLRWGTTDEEVDRQLPGDEIEPDSIVISTRAISIDAPAAAVWPWLVQIGQGRGGFYSYEKLENLFGSDIHNAERIVPELQLLEIGDEIRLAPYDTLPSYQAVTLEPERALVLQVLDPQTKEPGEGIWIFFLDEQTDGTTRLIVRHRESAHPALVDAIFATIFEPISFVMERGMMLGIRERVERNVYEEQE